MKYIKMKKLECLCRRDNFFGKLLPKNMGDLIFYKGTSYNECRKINSYECKYDVFDEFSGDSYCSYNIKKVEN